MSIEQWLKDAKRAKALKDTICGTCGEVIPFHGMYLGSPVPGKDPFNIPCSNCQNIVKMSNQGIKDD